MAQDIEGLLKTIRAHIDRKPEFEAYQDYFDTLRLLGKEDKAIEGQAAQLDALLRNGINWEKGGD